jgi:hypothetical protein
VHSVPARAAYEDIIGTLKKNYKVHQLAVAYRVQLKATIKLSGKSLHEFAAAINQLAH